MDRYQPIGLPPQVPTQAFVCLGCAAIVTSPAVHDRACRLPAVPAQKEPS